MKIKIYQVDAFTETVFKGNPAAVCPLDQWLSDDLLLKIADENNLSETAFFVPEKQGFRLRWFTPEDEVDLCGHATLATAHVIFKHLGYNKEAVIFYTKSGELQVRQSSNGYSMSFPATEIKPIKAPDGLFEALGVESALTWAGFDDIVILENQSQVHSLTPDFSKLMQLDSRGVVVTAVGDETDFVSRCFFPKYRVNEDPVTGSAHCELAPFWAKQLGRNQLTGKQLSKRGGLVHCEVKRDRVHLSGQAVDYMSGNIFIANKSLS
jgi:PhzF family phenazine biosynthesis protein